VRQGILRACALGAAVATAGCGPRVGHTEASIEALARSVLAAVERQDVARLHELAVSEQEFRDVVWPELPASRPERNLTADYVWNDLRRKSDTGLQQGLRTHGGRAMELVAAHTAGETSQYRSFLVRRDTVLMVRDAAGGPVQTLRLFGSVLEARGGFKVFSYVVD
jgi:hypothetical protein